MQYNDDFNSQTIRNLLEMELQGSFIEEALIEYTLHTDPALDEQANGSDTSHYNHDRTKDTET